MAVVVKQEVYRALAGANAAGVDIANEEAR